MFRRKYDHPIPDDERALLQMFEEGTSKVLPRKAGDKAFTLVCKLASPVAPQDAHPLAVFQALNKIELHIWHCDDRKGSVRAIYSSPLHKGVDPPKGWIRVVLLLYKGHYLSVRDPAGLIQEQWSKHHGHKDMCFRCLKLHSDRAKLHLHYKEGLCAKLTEAVCNLPSKSKCSFNFGRNAADASSTLPCPFFLEWDTEAFTQLIRTLSQAEQAGFKPRYDAEQGGWHCEQWGKEHQLSGIGVVACCPHPEFEAHMKQHKPELHKLLGYHQYKHGSTPEDMMRWFFKLIIECSLLARYWLTDASEPLAPSPAELDEFESASKCVICLKGFTDTTEAELNDMFDEIMPLLQKLKELMPEPAEGNLTWSSPPDSWKTLYREKKPLNNYYNHITATAFGLLNAELKGFVVTGPKCTKCHNASVLKVGSKRKTPAYFGCNHCFYHGKPLCVKRLGTEVQLTDRYCSIHSIHADVGARWKIFKEAAGDIKHHHHCHITGKTYGAAHFLCNILASYKNYKTPCFAHFATSYDHHWPIQFAKIAQEVIMEFKGAAEKLADDEGGKESDDEDSMGFAPAEEMKYKSTELIDSDDDSSNELTESEVAQPAAKKQKRIPAKSKQLVAYSGLIGQNAEKLKAFTLWRLVQFNDSFLHLPEKLSDLVDERGLNHAVDCKDTIEFIMKRYKRSYDDAFKLVSAGKAHFPHDAHNSLTFLDAIKELVSKVLMYNRKDSKALSEEDYLFCCWVWKTFGCKTMRDFHDLYLLLDCLLHKDALRKYAVETYENYGINPYKQLTTPSTTTRAMRRHLNRIGEDVEVLNEEDHTPDDYTTNEDGIVGGINGVDGPRYARANHKHLTSIIITPSRILIPNVGEGMDNPRIALGINLESTLPCGYRGTAKDDGKGFEGDQLLAYDGVQEDTRRLCQGTGKVHILPVFDVVDWVTGDVLGQLSIGQVILSEVVTHEPIAMEVRETVAWDWWIPRPERDKDSGDWVRRTHEPIKNAAYIMNPMKPKPVYSDDSKQLVKSSLYLFLTSQGFKLTKVDTVKVVESDYIDIVPLLQHIHLDKMRSAGFFPKTLDRRERLQRERSGSEYLLPTQQCRGELNDVQAQLLQPFSEDDKRGKSLSKEDLRGVRYKATTFYNPTIATTHIDPFDAVNLYGASMSKPLPKRGYARANWPRLKESDLELTDAKMLRDLREKVKNEAAAWEQVADAEVELASLDEETDDATDAVQSARKKVEALRANAILEELHGMQLDVTVGPPKDPATMYDHRDLPMLLNRRKVEYAELSDYMKQQLKFLDKEHDTTEKLVLDFHPKRITVDYHFLAFMLEHGYEVLEIHQLITYEQSRWLAGYVAFNTAKRVEHDKVGNKAGVRTAKNMINMMYGRLAQRVRDYKNLEHVTCEDTPDSRRTQLQKVSDPLFTGRYVVNDEGVIISKRRMTHKLDKKPDAAVVVLWDSKLTMFQGLYYGRVKPHLQRKGIHVQSLSKDTDCMKLLTVSDDSNFDIYRELAEMQAEKPMFDFSDIPKDFPYGLYEDTYRKRPGFFSHDSEGKFIIESGTTRSKVYSDLFINGYSHKERGKGTPKYTVKAMSSHFHVMRCIRGTTLENQKQTVKFMKIGSDNHHLFSKEQERLMHVNIDSKRYQLDAIESIPFGLPLSAIPEISQDIDRFTSDASSV